MSAGVAQWLGALALPASALSILAVLGCSSAFPGTKVEGEPCTRTDECVASLMCVGGVCRGADAGPRFDAGRDPEDAGLDGDDADVLDADTMDADVLDADVDAEALDADVLDGDVTDAETAEADEPDAQPSE